MTKREAVRQTEQTNTLVSLGFTETEAEQLRRISLTLHRWHELECGVDGGGVERNEETGKVTWYSSHTGKRTPYADRETGARKRLAAIVEARNKRTARQHTPECVMLNDASARELCACQILSTYIQTDPRGAALYIIRPGDVPEGADVSAYYSRGICVY